MEETITVEQYNEAKEIVSKYRKQKAEVHLRKSSNPMTWKEAIKKYNLKNGDTVHVDMIQLEKASPANPHAYYTWWGQTFEGKLLDINIYEITKRHVYIGNHRWLPLRWKVSIIKTKTNGN
jgi:hypothetical protein